MTDVELLESKIFKYAFDVPINQKADKLWSNLIEQIDAWWMADFRALGEGSKVSLSLGENGVLVEKGPSGETLEWYRVQMCVPGKSLYLVGHVAPDWGGPTTSMLKLEITADGDASRLTVSDALLGNVSKAKAEGVEDGWKQMFNTLKIFCEK